jgi:hypothetical protein
MRRRTRETPGVGAWQSPRRTYIWNDWDPTPSSFKQLNRQEMRHDRVLHHRSYRR